MLQETNQHRKYKTIFWILFALPFLVISIIFLLISFGALGFMPTFEDLENPQKNVATEVISEDGKILGNYYYENRTYIRYDQISPNMVNALIATEDIRFYNHSGIDFRGLARVFFKSIILGSNSGGGSTISQQLAKNLFPRDSTSYNFFLSRKIALAIAKFKEWQTAVKLERNYTKDEILTMYLNTVDFGSQAFGIKMASKTFFGKTADSLKIEEAAVLVGLLKAPTRYSPILNPERSLARRNVVLYQMFKNEFISEAQYDSLVALPLNINYFNQDHNEGIATYFREYIRGLLTAKKPQRERYQNPDSYEQDSIEWETNPAYGWCNKHFKPDGTPYNIYADGLKIYTTINYKMQAYAEESVKEHLSQSLQPAFYKEKKGMRNAPFSKDLDEAQREAIMETAIKRTERYRVLRNAGLSWNEIKKNFKTKTEMTVFTYNGNRDTMMTPYDSIKYYKFFLRASFMSMNPHNGHVKAYVGGANFRHFKYDQVCVGKRQAGSTIKPFIYTLAMEEGLSPCDKVPNVPVTFLMGDSVWTPKNSGRSDYEGKMVTLKWGLANSVNYISAWVMKQYNPTSVIEIMRKMGFKSYLAPYPSLVLGTSDVSLYEMVGAYSSYANKGFYVEPIFITRIEDRNGNVISTFVPEKTEAISEQTAYLMLNLMQGVVNAGTAVRLRYMFKLMNPIAGKTGTTQNHSDGWFIGVTPDLVSGSWVGAEDRSIRFDNLEIGQGANMALPIWALFMKKVYADKSLNINQGEFERPSNFGYTTNCTDTEDADLNNIDINMIEGEGY